MEHDEFIGQTQHRADSGSHGDAERAARATPTVFVLRNGDLNEVTWEMRE